MNATLLIINTLMLTVLFTLAFLVLGALRTLGVLNWRLDQLEAMRPSRLGRDGLKIGRRAPDFSLPCATGGQRSLGDLSGRKVLLVMTQTSCGPCRELVPELNRVQKRGEYQVLVVNYGKLEVSRKWADEARAHFPILVQETLSVSKTYEVFATPFAFVIDEKGLIVSKGMVSNRQYLGFVLSGEGQPLRRDESEVAGDVTDQFESDVSLSI